MGNQQLLALTDKQSRFVAFMLEGECQTVAARLAGYSAPTVDGCRLMQSQAVRAALQDGNLDALLALTPKARQVLMKALEDPDPRVRLKAVELALKFGLRRHDQAPRDPKDKALADMTADELAALSRRLLEQRAALDAKTIEATPEAHNAVVPIYDPLGLSET